MKKMYETDYGETFEDCDEAMQSVIDNMSINELFDAIEERTPYRALLEWAWKQPNFFDEFEFDISEAEWGYAADLVHEIEVPENEEEE